MKRWMFLFFGLALLLSAVAPAWEPLDRWDRSPAVSSDTEFHAVAFAVGVGLAVTALLLSHHLLRGLRYTIAIAPVLAVSLMAFHASTEAARANGPPISSPLRI